MDIELFFMHCIRLRYNFHLLVIPQLERKTHLQSFREFDIYFVWDTIIFDSLAMNVSIRMELLSPTKSS